MSQYYIKNHLTAEYSTPNLVVLIVHYSILKYRPERFSRWSLAIGPLFHIVNRSFFRGRAEES
jgi:hypothetical protein